MFIDGTLAILFPNHFENHFKMKRLITSLYCLLLIFPLFSQTLPNPVIFCANVPNPAGFATSMETFGNQHASIYAAPRGGDLYIRYPNGTLKNLTQLAGYGMTGQQGANAIAVRDVSMHWDGQKALFSMVIGAPTQQYIYGNYHWQLYEVTGLGINDTPVITLVPNQPENYNNVQPIYGTDDRIIFVSDRPRGGQAHLYPQHDEYESSAIVTGVWKLDPTACSMEDGLEMLTHSPSGDFTPFIDSYGRLLFIRWDHLKRDQQADADIISNYNNGTFNYMNESDTATAFPILPDIEVFPEPRQSRTDLLSLPEWANTNPQDFNIFNPWMMNEDGTELEILNHMGRHEFGGNYFTQNFTNDPNLTDFNSIFAPTPNPVRSMFHIMESPTTPGLYYGTESGEFGTHASGMIFTVQAPPGLHPEDIQINFVTHPDTRSPTDNPEPEHSGLYRNPVPLSDGQVLVVHSPDTRYDQNEGSTANPDSRYDYRLRLLEPDGAYYQAASSTLTGAGISKTLTWWSPDVLVSYSGLLWETYPAEVIARPRPANPTLDPETVPAIEQALFDSADIDLPAFRKFLRRNNLALAVTRDVTSRDDADHQQPYNLKVWGSSHQTIDPDHPTNIYEVKYMQYLQADQLRGKGGIANPSDGRRPIARWLHDDNAMAYNLPTSGNQGSVNVHPDGSVAVMLPANRAVTWQLTDQNNKGIVRERLWLSFVPGEVRMCTSCHGESTLNQAGFTSPQNPPLALTALLNHVSTIDRDNDNIKDLYDAYPLDASKYIAQPVSEDFQNNLVAWLNENNGNDAVQWTTQDNVPCNGRSAVINNRLVNNTGTTDRLSRVVDLSNMDMANLSFKVAYARYNNALFDRLKVIVVPCGGVPTVVYDKAGSDLATAPDQTTAFTPADCSQWRTECIDLSAFAGQTITLIFENTGGWGNKLYLDNINIIESDSAVPTPVIAGTADPCSSSSSIYTITSYYPPGATFNWTVTGGTITNGQGTHSVTVLWGNGTAGDIGVTVSP